MPNDDARQCHRVSPSVQQSIRHVISADKHRQRVLVGKMNGKHREPPSCVVEGNLSGVMNDLGAVSHVIKSTNCAQRIHRAELVVCAGFELHPGLFFTHHRSVYAQIN